MNHHFPGDQAFGCGAAAPAKPPPSECPRCGSMNTKFCYYNNYNKSQPRYLCKSCKRHWTKGGALRNIPAGRRRRTTNKRPHASAAPQPKQSVEKLLSLTTDQRNTSDILYQALTLTSSTSIPESTIFESSGTTRWNGSVPQNRPNAESTSSNFDFLIGNSNINNFAENFDSTEESTVTVGASPPWPAANASKAADLWSWNDLLGSSADFNTTVWDNLIFF